MRGGPGDPQQPTSGTHAGEPTGTAVLPPLSTVDADARSDAAADPGPDTQTSPAASPVVADTAEDSRRRLAAGRAKFMAPMSMAEMDRIDRDLIHYNTDEELDSRRFGMGTPGTIGVSIRRINRDAGGPGDPQQPTSGTHAG